ncbi:MAG TPA: hypothetical protein VF263_26270 [Longimicrobiaceae bacterium]
MSRKKKTTGNGGSSSGGSTRVSDLEQARNDLFGHIHRCGVLRATEEQQLEWIEDTIGYIGECYPSLSEEQLGELKTIGLRFCRPVIANGPTAEAPVAEQESGQDFADGDDVPVDEEDLSMEEASAA